MAHVSILTREEWTRKKEDETSKIAIRGLSSATRFIPPYHSQNEAQPDHSWYRLDKARIDAGIRDFAMQAHGALSNAREEDKELMSLSKLANDIQKVTSADAKEAALVGMQGVGKSLLINALQDRRNLSKTSAEGGACTASAIRYLHKPGCADRGDTYDAAIQFMDDEHLNEIAEEHARRYHYVQFQVLDQGDEFAAEDEEAAGTARDFFSLIFNVANDPGQEERLEKLLTEPEIKNGSLVRETLKLAKNRIEEAGADAERTITFRNLEVKQLMQQIEGYVAAHTTRPSLWPIVQYVNVFMGSTLTKNGVLIIDLPGLGDINQSRTAATYVIRRNADFEIILGKSERVITEGSIHRQIRQSIKAHGARNTVLVLTKIDEYLSDNHHVETQIDTLDAHPFGVIKQFYAEAAKEVENLEQQRPPSREERADRDAKVDMIQLYQEYLHTEAKIAFIRLRAENVERVMRSKSRP